MAHSSAAPDESEFRQAKIQEIQLHQQRRVTAQLDVDAHDLPQDGDARDLDAGADQADHDRQDDAEDGNEQRHFGTADEERRVVRE